MDLEGRKKVREERNSRTEQMGRTKRKIRRN
jgi:hypothetical protein